MKLRRLFLDPFAGFRTKELFFEPGLNVVLGANDQGKSTIFRAIDAALFLPHKLSRSTKEGRDLLPRVIPLGGDHARVTVEGDSFSLTKTWGQGAGVSFESGGQRLAQEEKVEESLRALLPVPAATFQSVLFMGQGALEKTVSALESRKDALHSLGDLLRVGVNQTSGVSVEKLKARLAEKLEAAFSHWDRACGMPEKGKGIEDPWKKGVGSVLAAFYAREEIRRDRRVALELESARSAKSTARDAKHARREECRAFLAANKKLVDSASQRVALESQLFSARQNSDALVKDLDSWAKSSAAREMSQPEVARLEQEVRALEAELSQALAGAKLREQAARLLKARELHEKVCTARAALAALPVLKAEDLRRARVAAQEVESLRASLKSGKIVLQLQAKREFSVTMKKDLDPERSGTMTPGKPLVLNAGGRIQLSSDFFELTVASGEGQAAQVEELFARKSDELGKIFAGLGVATLEEAQERFDRYQEAGALARSSEAALAGMLGAGETFESLEKAVGAAPGGGGREPQLISAELQARLKDLGAKKEALVRADSVMKDLERRHGVASSDALMEKLIALKAVQNELARKLAELPALPPGLGNVEALVLRFEKEQAEAAGLAEEIQTLAVELADLKARMPDQSAEDLTRALLEAETNFDRELARGKALLRVEKAVAAVEGDSAGLYGGFRALFEKQVALLSRGRYGSAAMKDALPSEFTRADGAVVPFEWLSAGTKDAFALALRLSMAGHFLGSSNGFLMIDDPLVNLDPERQKITAGLLQAFAAERQVILFTCHPSHAELLGGNLISL